MPTVTIVIPAYNGARTLAKAIQSALDQTGADLEIVVVDDGSNDGTVDVAKSFVPRVRVLTGPNRGVSHARNRGIAETGGEWIVFLDADDFLLPGTLKKRLDTASAAPCDVVVCDWQDLVESQDGDALGEVRSVDFNALSASPEIACATDVWATTAALMYRRTLVEKIGGFREDLPMIEDARFLFEAAYHGARFLHAPHLGAHYRVRPDSLSRHDPLKFWRYVFMNGQQIESLWRARGELTPEQRQALAEIYDTAARGLFDNEHQEYFDAIRRRVALGGQLSRHIQVFGPLAKIMGVHYAKRAEVLVRGSLQICSRRA